MSNVGDKNCAPQSRLKFWIQLQKILSNYLKFQQKYILIRWSFQLHICRILTTVANVNDWPSAHDVLHYYNYIYRVFGVNWNGWLKGLSWYHYIILFYWILHLSSRTRERSGAGHGGETPATSKLRTVRAATENSEQKTPGTQFWRGQTMEPWAFGTDVALNCGPLTAEVVSNIHAKVHTCTHNAHLRLIARHTSDTIIWSGRSVYDSNSCCN